MNRSEAKKMQHRLGITDEEFEKQLAHFDRTGQVLNRAVALARGLCD